MLIFTSKLLIFETVLTKKIFFLETGLRNGQELKTYIKMNSCAVINS